METDLQDVRLDQVRSATAEQVLSKLLEERRHPTWRNPTRRPRRKVPPPTLVDAERLLSALVAMADNLKPILDIHPNIRLIPLYDVDSGRVCTCVRGQACEHAGKHPMLGGWTNSEEGSASVFVLAAWLFFGSSAKAGALVS